MCLTADGQDQFLKPLAQCATCIASDTTANAAGKALVDSWVTGMDTTCNPKVTMYGKCNTCEAALRELSPFCHGQTTAECNKACTVSSSHQPANFHSWQWAGPNSRANTSIPSRRARTASAVTTQPARRARTW